MKKQADESPINEKRYLVLLANEKKANIRKAEKELDVKLSSSEELNSKVRAQDIMSKTNGIIFKNLDVAVVDEVDPERLIKSVSDPKSPILHWEKEREFYTVSAFDQLAQMKLNTQLLQQQIDELEQYLREQEKPKNDRWENSTWGINAINLARSQYRGKGINLCVLDTGIDASHPDFIDRIIEGKSFIPNEAWEKDGNGHGTHCAGTAAGGSSRSSGIRYGVADKSNLFIGKVLTNKGSGSTSGIIDAIDWALEKKCKVISMSLGSPVRVDESPSFIFESIGQKALSKGCLIVAAAGNDSNRPLVPHPVSQPANSQSIMAVAAIEENLTVAYFSNAGINSKNGGRVDVAGPGVNVYSTFSKYVPGNNEIYKNLSGTSMATPHVAGLAALFWEAFPNSTAADIWLKLEKNAQQLTNQTSRDIGAGLAQAK